MNLLCRFMIQHVQDLHEHVTNSSHIKTRGKDWEEIKKRVTNQVVLRVVSCIQIASKLTSHYRVSPFLQHAEKEIKSSVIQIKKSVEVGLMCISVYTLHKFCN